MKQFIIPFVLLSSIFFGCSKEENNQDVVPTTPVDSFITICKPLKITSEGANYVQTQEYGYNSKGYEINFRRIRDGIVEARLTNYIHDTNGNIIFFKVIGKDNENIGTQRSTFNSENNPLTTSFFINPINRIDKTEWFYNSRKIESGLKKFINDSLTCEHKNYQYDSNDSIIYYERTWGQGVNGIISKTFSASGKILSHEIKNLNQNGLVTKTEWTYDSDEFIIVKKYFRNGASAGEVQNYQYDEHGNITYSEFFNVGGELSTKETRTYQCFEIK